MQRIFRNIMITSQYRDLNDSYCQGRTYNTITLCEHGARATIFSYSEAETFPLLTARPAATGVSVPLERVCVCTSGV